MVKQNNHDQCNAVQRGLEIENQRLNKEIESLIIKLKNAENQLNSLRIEVSSRDIQSPKHSIGTKVSNSPREEGKRSIVISQVEREDEEGYGQNYFEYINGDGQGAGTLDVEDRQEFAYQGSYHSGIHEPRDLTGSAATYRSGQVITSSQYIRSPNTINNTESARYIQEREGTQYSGTTAGVSAVSGVKKYNYYQKKYEGNST